MCKEVRAVVYRHNNGAGDTTGYESSAARRSFHDKCTSIPHGCWVLNRRSDNNGQYHMCHRLYDSAARRVGKHRRSG
ncbi:hypothetical protein LSAT2_010357 [Lamellibrachia satsuma]|nr:hypothetical protein LSAT2_010357 [Lamellibrachia satsuma]